MNREDKPNLRELPQLLDKLRSAAATVADTWRALRRWWKG